MDFEQYTVILKHEITSGMEKIEVEPPLILTHTFDRRFIGSTVSLNELMDRLKEEVLKRSPSVSPLTPDKFMDKMHEIVEKHGGYEEPVHIEMDDLMCEVLESLGYEDGVRVFKKQDKWYS